MNDRARFLIRELSSDRCFCGATKRPMQSFCRPCYSSLPPLLRKALYKRVGEGYEHAYDEAAAFLRSREGWL
jgi:hypothetical protein